FGRRPTYLRSELPGRTLRLHHHYGGREAVRGMAADDGEVLPSVGLRPLLRRDDDGRRAVVQPRGVARRHGPSFGAECRPELRQGFERGIPPRRFIRFERGLLTLAAGQLDRDDLLAE